MSVELCGRHASWASFEFSVEVNSQFHLMTRVRGSRSETRLAGFLAIELVLLFNSRGGQSIIDKLLFAIRRPGRGW